MEILLPRMKYTHEIVGSHGGALLPERAPGVCSRSKTPRVYRPKLRAQTVGEISAYWSCVQFSGYVEMKVSQVYN